MPNTSEISVPAIDTRPPLPSKALVDSFQNRGAEMPFPLNPMLRELADLSNFRANAVIDFIRLEFETVEPTQFR